ncbi:PhzF family phenazine biosynthesis protein [Kordiimonas gwangyangensis]|uniref:PhzF family phenazine biosynthesis protein n=1 Tax=Kordiimonas gwangyangensis TaxID=288022 RepID=UPI00036F4FDB|nr:PhzF family phenazine biosynthesis protein [Kordiimonas gwangyangensis]
MKKVHEMKKQEIEIGVVNAFVKNAAGGNPAGVVLGADGLQEAEMQALAAAVGYSETAFVSSHADGGFQLDFFTPNRRIADCGHATVAAFSHMAAKGIVADGETIKHTVDGPRKVVIKDGQAFMEQLAPRYLDAPDWKGVTTGEVLASLGLEGADLLDGHAPVVVNTGNSFMLVGVRCAATLAAITPVQAKIEAISDTLDLIGYYVFTLEADSADASTRMFAPRYGIPEESATGMAAGPLACLLHDRLGATGPALTIEQGRYMAPSSVSEIHVALSVGDDGHITGLMAGGRALPGDVKVVEVPHA